jgi:class 3 adenylate cyclase/predicted ATPase
MDVGTWLGGLGLERYAEAFAENGIDFALIPELTNEDLKDLGVMRLADRKTILKAIEAMGPDAETGDLATPAGQAVEARPEAGAERRQLTVMFVDMVGSTALSGQLDPEQLRDIILAFQNAVVGAVSRYEGHIAKFMGDGVLAYFGWPQAHEDDAERAVRAGLSMMPAMSEITTPKGETLDARIGIATGLVVVGDLVGEGPAQEEAVVGETPNLAARLQGLAEPRQIVLSAATRGLLGALFELTDLGPQALKGFAGPVPAYSVVGERAVESRFEARAAGAVLPLVGREQELALVLERWRQSKAGEGQMVLLTGEAGIGKSRIARAAIDAIAVEPHVRINYQCSPYHGDSALYPAMQQLIQAAGLAPEDDPEAKLDKLEAHLAQAHDNVGEIAPLIASLLNLQTEGRYSALGLSPEQQRVRTLEALISRLLGLARRQPVLFVLEDAHWIDPTTLELIELGLDRIADAPVMLMVTARPSFTHGFGGHPIVTRLALNRLGRKQTEGIIARLSGDKALPAEVLDEIVAKTDGVPLFVEELTKTVLESANLRETEEAFVLDGPLQGLMIPSSLNDSLMARLDRLQAVKELAQTAACIGREFGYGLLAAVSPLPDAELRKALDALVAAELIFRHGQPPEARYTFKHALIQDAAYDALLRTTRQRVHGRIAEALQAGLLETAAAHPELLAQHFTAAGRADDAVDYWLQAGRQAAERSANKEAIGHLNKGLAVLRELPVSTEQSRRELDFQLELCGPYMSTKGWGGVETAKTFARARDLCTQLGETEQLPPVLNGEYMRELSNGHFRAAREAAAELLRFGEQQRDSDAVLQGHRILGWGTLYLGEFSVSQTHIDEALRRYDPAQHGGLKLRYANDTRVAALCVRAILHCICGQLDQARAAAAAAIDYARSIDHAPSLAYALMYAGAMPAALRNDPRQAGEFAEELLSLSDRLDSPLWLGCGRVMAGWSASIVKPHEDGVQLFLQGLESLEATAPNPWKPVFHTFLAETRSCRGETDKALLALETALQHIERTEERMWEAGVHILLGKTLLAQDSPNAQEAEASLHRGNRVAQRQGAKSLELRATTSIARLWQSQGKRREARDLLVPIYDWFTEGFDTPDLIEAKKLLNALN